MQIKGYKILREIHRGAITTVYEAIQQSLDRKVLLKVLNQQWLNHPDLVERIKREAKISAKLDHPHIVKVFDFHFSDQLVFICMEFVEGITLTQFINKNHPVQAETILKIAEQLLTALNHAHSLGAIHRDIKPDNILIDNQGQVKITDFGLATIKNIARVTAQESIIGSPAYMAPEILKGEEPTPQSDIFSLGLTLYELVAGKHPFLTPNVGQTIQNLLLKKELPLAEIRPDLPTEFFKLVHDMLNKDIDERIAECSQCLAVLKSIKKNPVTEYKITTNSKKEKTDSFYFSRKKIAAVLIPLIGVFFGYQFWQMPEKDNPRPALVHNTALVKESTIPVIKKLEKEKSGPKRDKSIGKLVEPRQNTNLIKPEKVVENKPIINPAKNGGLFVIVKPWAEIWIGGQKVDVTPLQKPISLKPGQYHLALKNSNYESFEQILKIHNGKVDTMRVALKPKTGSILLRIKPWAKVKIDGKDYGISPFQEALILPAGKHKIRLENDLFGAKTDSFYVQQGSRQILKYDLTANN